MSEICLKCWNKINGTKESSWRYVISWEHDLCEECGEWKRVLVKERLWSQIQRGIAERIVCDEKDTGGLN